MNNNYYYTNYSNTWTKLKYTIIKEYTIIKVIGTWLMS